MTDTVQSGFEAAHIFIHKKLTSLTQSFSEIKRRAIAVLRSHDLLQEFLFCLYGSLSFILSSLLLIKFEPIISTKVSEAGLTYYAVPNPHFPWGYKVIYLAIPIFMLPFITYRIPALKKEALRQAVITFLAYLIPSYVSLLNFGLNVSVLVWSLGFGFVVSSPQFVKYFKIDFAFLERKNMSASAKTAKLQIMYDKWTGAMKLLLTVSIAVCVTALIKLVAILPAKVGEEAAEIMTRNMIIVSIWAGIGLTLGPFTQMFKKLKEIEDKFLEVEERT